MFMGTGAGTAKYTQGLPVSYPSDTDHPSLAAIASGGDLISFVVVDSDTLWYHPLLRSKCEAGVSFCFDPTTAPPSP